MTRNLLAASVLAVLASSASAATPPNDSFSAAHLISGASGSTTGTTVGATKEPGEPKPHKSGSIWYRWTAPSDGTVTFTKSGANYGPTLDVYTGDSLSGLTATPATTEYGYSDGARATFHAFRASAAVTYHIYIDSGPAADAPGADFALRWSLALPPPNDHFADAQVMEGESGDLTAKTSGATLEPSEPGSGGAGSVWYSWVAPRSGLFFFEPGWGVLHAFSGETVGALTLVGDSSASSPYVALNAVGGTRYALQVVSSSASLQIKWVPAARNDDFSACEAISGPEGTVRGQTRGASKEPSEPAHAGYTGGRSVWYDWTAPADGYFSFGVHSEQFAAALGVYTGGNVASLESVTSGSTGIGESTPHIIWVTFRAAAGTTYRLAVDHAMSQSFGHYLGGSFDVVWKQGTSATDATLLNLSTRARVGPGADALIGGFIVRGDVPKKVIIRAIAPSLGGGNGLPIQGILADPMLDVHNGAGDIIFSNDDWVSSPQKQAIIDSTIPPAHEKEAAIVMTLPPGNYTAVVTGKSAAAGIAVVELYDLDPSSSSQLVNVSSRGRVESNENAMIAGVIVGGTLPTKVVVRALGPSMRVAGEPVPDALQDMVLELRSSNGDLLVDSAQLRQSAEAIAETGLTPPHEKEAALVAPLMPGNYTAIVRALGSQGVALVEVYNLN